MFTATSADIVLASSLISCTLPPVSLDESLDETRELMEGESNVEGT
jgi:hypothetical protein